MYNDQAKEIETIKERDLKLKLSDADVERITEKAESHGLTVAELLQNFIGDLVGGTYSNGSDERDFADRWFDRCWFGMFPDETLLRYLIEWGEIDEFLNTYEFMNDMRDNVKITLEEDEPDAEEIESYQEDADSAENELKEIYTRYAEDVREGKPQTYEEGLAAVLAYKERLDVFKGVE